MRTIKTRREAAEAGESKYYTGKPCIHGHLGYRYTSSGICCACNVANARKYNKQMGRQINEHRQGYFSYLLHPDDHAAALAYCQALDVQRGVAPKIPKAPVAIDAPLVLPEHLARFRENAFNKYPSPGNTSLPPYLPKP